MDSGGTNPADGTAARGSWWRRAFRPRTVVVGVLALGLLTGAGYGSKPQWQHWWYGATLCDGAISSGDLNAVLEDRDLKTSDEVADRELGRFKCGLRTEIDKLGLSARSYTRPDDVDSELAAEFGSAQDPRYVFPPGIPGFETEHQLMVLQRCPDLGRDVRGRQRRMVTTLRGEWFQDPSAAALRMTVSLANTASEKLDCGAEPLPEPTAVRPEEPPAVPLGELAGTPCGWLAGARLPEPGSGGAVRAGDVGALRPGDRALRRGAGQLQGDPGR